MTGIPTENQTAAENRRIGIAATAVATPPHELGRDEAKAYLRRVFSLAESRIQVLLAVIDNSQIRRRFFVQPTDYVVQPRPLSQITREYQHHAIELGRTVTADCLQRSGMAARDIDMIITVSCTGLMIPSLDAHLINEFGFRSDIRRLPITELGCVGGATALSRAREFVRATPGANVLVVSVEIPSLTFQRGDHSQANLISCVLFGDGAAAAVVTDEPVPGPKILATNSHFYPNSIDAMGFELRETGLHIVLSRGVPQMIRTTIKDIVLRFLQDRGIGFPQVSRFVLHPGGQKLLAFMEEELGLTREQTQHSWRILSEYGNLSSASVFFVLHDLLAGNSARSGDYGLMAAFGPGFSAELLLLQWE